MVFGLISSDFAELYSNTVSSPLRLILACVTFWMPFSLAETFVLLAPILLVFFLIRAVYYTAVYGNKGKIKSFFVKLFSIVLILLSVFINTFGICYKRYSAEKMFGFDTSSVTQTDVEVTAAILLSLADNALYNIYSAPNGATVMPYGADELTEKIMNGYSEVVNILPPVVSVKRPALSEPWTYTHISGMYMPLTGESNVNANYPDYVVAFTTAHEIAHQLGIANENDANYFAFLACISSDDHYLVYSACLNIYEYLVRDMSYETVEYLSSAVNPRIIDEYVAYSEFFEKYSKSEIAEFASTVNDTYLKSQGVSSGVESYSDVTSLVCAFFKSNVPEYYS